MNRGREVLVGKLAIGRRVLERADAIRCFHASNGEPFWEVAVRQGLLQRAQADDLVRTIDEGKLVCRGACREMYPLDATRPPEDDRCPRCTGPLYVTSKQAAASRETWRDPQGTPNTHAEAIREARAEPPAPRPTPAPPKPAPATPAAFEDDADLQVTIPPRPVRVDASPPRAVVAPPAALDSLPSAIPIKPKKLSGATRSPHEETKDDPPSVHVTPAGPRAADPDGFTPFQIGNIIEVLAPIGKGGMGSVFRARHKALNQIVAIKIFTCHQATDDEQQKRFDREVKTMAKLNHPGIVQVRGGGVVQERGPYEKRPYYIMEYVAGRDLSAWARERPRSPGACVAMLARVCEVVDFFHSKLPWIVHRDLKPQNVIVSNDADVPKICDFGLAKVEDSKLTRTGDIMGTPQFMPPEQARGENKKIGPPTDVYSLGAILYFLLTGEPPFDIVRTGSRRSPLVELIDRIVNERPPRPRAKNPATPSALEAVILKCFEKDPSNRFHNARELGVALRGLNLPL